MTFLMFASRAKYVEVSTIRKMFEAPHPDAINLGLGEPDMQPPERVMRALIKAVESGKNKYGPTGGVPELRQAVAEKLQQYSDVKADQILVTTGATEALCLTMQTLVDVGDEVLTPDPGFVLFKPHIKLASGVAVSYSLKKESNFCPDIEELRSLTTKRTKAMIVNSPSNPTGAVYDRKTIDAIVDFAKEKNLILISDEVYDQIVYERAHESFLGKYENVIYVNSFSKVFAMTGWRLGYLTGPSEIVKQMGKIHYYMVACPSTPTQYAALEGLRDIEGFVKKMVMEFQTRRDFIVNELNSIQGYHCLRPMGAFYAFPTFEHKITSEEMSLRLLEGGVICTPGRAFGEQGEGHLRFSYANSLENIKMALERIRKVEEESKASIK